MKKQNHCHHLIGNFLSKNSWGNLRGGSPKSLQGNLRGGSPKSLQKNLRGGSPNNSWLAASVIGFSLLCLPNYLLAQDAKPNANPTNAPTNAPTNVAKTAAQKKPVFTLRHAFMAAYNHDPRIKAAMANVKANRAAFSATRSARLPQLSVNSSYGTLDATVNGETQSYAGQQINNGINITAPIATFGRQDATEKSSASRLASAKIDFEQKKSILFDDVTQSYFGLLFNEQVYRLKTENKNLLEKQLAESTERFDREAITITELRAVRTRLNNANIEMLNASASYMSQKQKLASLVGKDKLENLAVNSANEFLKKLPATLEDAKPILFTISPRIREAHEAVIRAKADVENSRANFFPQLSLQGGISSVSANGETTNQQYATLNLNMTFGNGFSGFIDQTRVIAQLKLAQYNLADSRNILLGDFQNRWENYKNYNQIVKDRLNNVKQYEKIYSDATRSLSLGQGTLSRVIDVRTRLIDQYISYANAVNSRTVYGLSLANSLGMIN